MARSATILIAVLGLAAVAGAQAQDVNWLSLCSQCLSPTIISKSGIGTAQAVAIARMTREGAAEWCGSWRPDVSQAACVKQALAEEPPGKTYRASADCTQGRITAVDGATYRLAGVWTSDVGRGRTKWRDSSGHIVGQDNASNGLGISQQWEILCPGATPGSAPRQPATAAALPAGTAFAIGQVIEARYGREWVLGRVAGIYRHEGANGQQISYDVRLANGRRGIVPASMLRVPSR